MGFWISLAILLAFYAWARKARAAKDQKGNSLNGSEQQRAIEQTIKIATYNVQTGKSLQGKRDISKSAAVIENADIVGIQEVYAPTWLNKFGIGVPQTQSLAMLPDWSGKSYRNYTVAKFALGDANTELVVLNTHLHTKQGRLEQLEIVLKEFQSYPCSLLMGDFNTKADEPVLREFIAQGKGSDLIAQARLDHPGRIDWILGRGLAAVDGVFVDKGVSDHPFYQVEVKIKA